MKTPYQFVLPFGLSDDNKAQIDLMIQNVSYADRLAGWVRTYTSNFREAFSVWSWEEWRQAATRHYSELLEWLARNPLACDALAKTLHEITHFDENEIRTYLEGGER